MARAVKPSPLTRISYQVGRPWMFEGKRFFPETGIPMRNIACISRLLALAEPVPLTLASLMAKSLARICERGACGREMLMTLSSWVIARGSGAYRHRAGEDRTSAYPRRQWDNVQRTGRSGRRYLHP